MKTTICDFFTNNRRGLLSVFGAFLIQLCSGCYHGTFGNLLPYFTSYMRQSDNELTNGDLAMIFANGGLAQGVSFLLAGLVVMPSLGPRPSLVLGCTLFTLSPILTYLALVYSRSVELLQITYGVLSSFSVNIMMLVTFTLPVTWFPNHRGKVLGFINGGFGLSSTVFSPLQSILVNPDNIAPVPVQSSENSSLASSSSYFMDETVLSNVPKSLLYLSAIFGSIFMVGIYLVVEDPKTNAKKEDEQQKLFPRLKSAWIYIYKDVSRKLDFYLLWLTRFLYLFVCAGILAHWKTFSFTQSDNDQMIAIAGGVSGVLNFLSRLVFGVLFDILGYSKLMSVVGILLSINLFSIYFVGQQSFYGLIISVWLVYILGFCHFSTIPAQAHKVFPGPNTYIVIGCIGLAESFSYGALGILNAVIMSDDSNPNMFLIFFITLGVFSLVSVPTTWFVSDGDNDHKVSNVEDISPEEKCKNSLDDKNSVKNVV